MQKSRKRKRLINVAVAFMLTFVVGAAFAFAPGVLDIRGTVNVTTLADYVTWYNVSYDEDFADGDVAPFAGFMFATSDVDIVAGADGRTLQRIVWTIDFDAINGPFGMAGLTAYARNHSIHDAIIEFNAPRWYSDGELVSAAFLEEHFDLVVTVDETGFVGVVDALGVTDGHVSVSVSWGGIWPATIPNPDYVVGGYYPAYIPTPAGHEFSFELVIEFEYEVAP